METRPLLTVKLSKPATPPWLLGRARLIATLHGGLHRRLTLLTAPAGYGKSTTLAAFFADNPTPALWLQLDEQDNDLTRFARYLAEGLRPLVPDSSTLWLLRQGQRYSVDDVAEVLASDLGRCQQLALVLDDLHLLAPEGDSVALVRRLLDVVPLSVHIYIASRKPPPFSVARLKARQQAVELTEADLRFAPAEVEQVLSVWAPGTLGAAELDRVTEQTEGWPAALVLVADALRRGAQPTRLPGSLPGDLISYLDEEVVPGLPVDVQAFMEQTSILAVCTPEMCDALLGRCDSAAILERLVQSHPLVTNVQPGAARYHALLRQSLEDRLNRHKGGVLARRLHVRAAGIFARQGLADEAVAHYLRAGHLDAASNFIARLAPRWINFRQTDRMAPILEQLPAGAVDQHPWLGVCAGWVRFSAGNLAAALAVAATAAAQFEGSGDRRGQVHALLLAATARAAGGDSAAALGICEQLQDTLPPEWRHELAVLLTLKANATILIGRPPGEAAAAMEQARQIYLATGDVAGEARICNELGPLCLRMGEKLRAISLLERSMELYRQLGDPPSELGFNLAWAYYSVGRFESAQAIYEVIFQGSVRKARRANAALNLISVYARLGRFEEAFRLGPIAEMLVKESGMADQAVPVRVALAAAYRLAGEWELALREVRDSMQQAAALRQPLVTLNVRVQAALLHLAHTGNLAAVRRLAAKALQELAPGYHPKEITLLMLADAVAAFRQNRSGARADAAHCLRLALGDCLERGFDALVLQEWPLALAAITYGLSFGVLPDYCTLLLRTMDERLPAVVKQGGIPLTEADARHLPAAWRTLPDAESRTALAGLLTSEDRNRLAGLGNGPAPLRIACLGPLTVQVGDRSIDPGALKKRKVGALLVLLLDQERWPREQLLEALWPDLDAQAANASLRVALHHLRRLFEPHLGGRDHSRYIQAEGGVVWLQRRPEMSVDLDEFRRHWERGKAAAVAGDTTAAVQHFAAARAFYRGPLYSDDPYISALAMPRQQVQETVQQMLLWLGDHYRLALQNAAESLSCYRQLLGIDTTHEAAHRGLIRAHIALGQWHEARQQYQECRLQLQQALGVEPSTDTQALLAEIHRQEATRSGRIIPLAKDRKLGTGGS